MDPNTALRDLLSAMSDYEDARGDAEGDHIDAADQMRDSIQALNGWLSKGGFLPSAWARGDQPSETLTADMSADDAYSLYESLEDSGEGTMSLMNGREVRIITEVSKV